MSLHFVARKKKGEKFIKSFNFFLIHLRIFIPYDLSCANFDIIIVLGNYTICYIIMFKRKLVL